MFAVQRLRKFSVECRYRKKTSLPLPRYYRFPHYRVILYSVKAALSKSGEEVSGVTSHPLYMKEK